MLAFALIVAVSPVRAAPPEQRPLAKTIYGADDRIDLFETADARLLSLADSTVALFQASEVVVDRTAGTATLSTGRFGDALQMCPDERFVAEPIGAFCSGFLVGPDLIATAGHCVSDSNCESTRFVFGYSLKRPDADASVVRANDVYACSTVLGREYDEAGADWALVRLDRRVEAHAALSVRRSGAIEKGEPVFVIGHPTGLPTKIAGGAAVRDASRPQYFTANLDTFGGNSGSAVFNGKTGLIEGILARGEDDFVWDEHRNCRASRHCPDDGCKGEDVTRISAAIRSAAVAQNRAEKTPRALSAQLSLDELGESLKTVGLK